ncbi:cholinesterase-like [Eublepharis macularius]|uniref:Carboxylic ester hydrolase n=1 Tax=Eublepharis macularius TaxID=481883 RepID=A0AA97J585_EUBMA|nr:cholinesterase-like [Eublepharis macularius]XP_054831285.1 cholinesterase-like [Eublepharis macularius]
MSGLCLSFLCVFLLFPLDSNSASGEDDTVVVTSSGPIKGRHLPVGSGTVTAYLGIPYAEPPLGKLRFQKPIPHQPWSQVLEATSFGNSCPQFSLHGFPDADMWAINPPLSEDCLFLNVWVPHPRPPTSVPVLVWIHGGGFITGSSSLALYNGASLAAEENLIVVSLNYRLGILGFLSLPPTVPGNRGLLDQQLALKWVHENAAAFGGDPTKVTILGQSAGAASVHFHLLSPGSQPLFAQAVLQSGSANAIWAWLSPEEARQKALTLGQALGCTQDQDAALVTCLQGKDVAEFSQYELSALNNTMFLDIPFFPTTDGEFLPKDPQKLLEAGSIPTKPVLIGTTSDEGSTFVPYAFPDAKDGLITWEQLLEGVKRTVRKATKEVIQAVALKYSEDDRGPARYRQALVQSSSDYFFVCPIAEFAAKLREAGSPVYSYFFSHHTLGSVWPEWIGAPHGAELPYLFGSWKSVLVSNQTFTEDEAALSHRVKQYWAEFARNGNPNGVAANEVQWPLYNATEKNFFLLGTEPPQILQKSPARRCCFWKTQVLNVV